MARLAARGELTRRLLMSIAGHFEWHDAELMTHEKGLPVDGAGAKAVAHRVQPWAALTT